MKKITLIKLGGSVITDKNNPYTFREKTMKRLAKEIKRAKIPVLIAHGGGSFPHTSALKYGGKKGYKSTWGFAKVARDAMEINRLVMDILIDEKIPAISFRPMSMVVSENGEVKSHNLEPILESLKQDLIPVVYGDVIMDLKFKSTIFSGEYFLNLVALNLLNNKIKVEKIIQVGETDGVYDNAGKTINVINNKNFNTVKESLFKRENDATGSMMHKIEVALKIANKGFDTYIINGLVKNNLFKALLGRKIKATIVR